MSLPGWYVSIAQPVRWGVAGTLALGSTGAVGGLIEAVDVYPVRSWFGVTLYLAMLGSIGGFILGLVCAAVTRRR